MPKKILMFFLCLAMLPCLCQAEASHPFSNQVHEISQEILAHQIEKASCASTEDWVKNDLPQQIGGTAEWFVLSLAQSGAWDFSAYAQALHAYLDQQTVRSANTRLKYALSFLASGVQDPYIASVMEDAIGKQGIVSWIYGLHLMNNGCIATAVTATEIMEKILSMQLSDGGWAITGAVSDTDVTAMAIQALAPHASQNEKIQSALDRAVSRLSALQQPDGGFGSFGVPNPESGAQVLIALSSLGIDGLQDERFIKNGHTILDAILSYRLPDGSYSHVANGESNAMATVQVFSAMVAFQRMLDGKGGLMVLDRLPGDAQENETVSSWSYKHVVSFILCGLFFVICLLLFILKKYHWKNYLAVLLAFSSLIAAVWLTDFQSAEDYYRQELPTKENVSGQITMAIRCDTAAQKIAADYVPKDGEILPETVFSIAPGDTPYAILTEAARAYSIHMESSGTPGMRYISGINYLYEFALGDLSGWLYFVNGESPSVSCDQYQLKDGDHVEWFYSCELGNDLK